ncbi:MAG: hypothetical protein HWN68_02630 [Desulfobacterales bacterium]|nr:hypothetical protein [Desulfobacterales bacterium]
MSSRNMIKLDRRGTMANETITESDGLSDEEREDIEKLIESIKSGKPFSRERTPNVA